MTFECHYCGAGFGIAGSLDTDDDWDAQAHFDSEVAHHESGDCIPAYEPTETPDKATLWDRLRKTITKRPVPEEFTALDAPRRTRDRIARICTDRDLSPADRGQRAATLLALETCWSLGITPPSITELAQHLPPTNATPSRDALLDTPLDDNLGRPSSPRHDIAICA